MYKRFADEVLDDLVEEMEESEQDKGFPVAVGTGAGVVGAAAETANLVLQVGSDKGDVTWDLENMPYAVYPNDKDDISFHKGVWGEGDCEVYKYTYAGPIAGVGGHGLLAAKFRVEYRYYKGAVGYVYIEPAGSADPVGGSVHVSARITVDPSTHHESPQGPFRVIYVRFNYVFQGIWDDAEYVDVKVEMRGDTGKCKETRG